MAFLWPSPAGVRVPMTMGLAALLAARILPRNADPAFLSRLQRKPATRNGPRTWEERVTAHMSNRVASNPRVGTRQTDKCAA